jgi:hypothetical protein
VSKLEAFDVRQVWDAILPGLQHIKRLTNADWRPEDLYSACLAKRMHVFKPDAAGSDFVLLVQNISPYTGKAYLLVLAAYSKEGDAIAKFQSEIDSIALESGCEFVEFASPRKGWERMAARHDYVEVRRLYRRNLDGRRRR